MSNPIERLKSLLNLKAPDAVIIGEFELLNAEIEKLHKELYDACELHTMQLAAIMTASIQNTESTVKDRITRDHPYCSQSYLDVCATVDREMQLRNQVHECGALLQQRNKEIEELKTALKNLESKATLLVQEYDINNNWKDHPEIVNARIALGI